MNKFYKKKKKALGPTWFNTFEKMQKDKTLRYNLLGE